MYILLYVDSDFSMSFWFLPCPTGRALQLQTMKLKLKRIYMRKNVPSIPQMLVINFKISSCTARVKIDLRICDLIRVLCTNNAQVYNLLVLYIIYSSFIDGPTIIYSVPTPQPSSLSIYKINGDLLCKENITLLVTISYQFHNWLFASK